MSESSSAAVGRAVGIVQKEDHSTQYEIDAGTARPATETQLSSAPSLISEHAVVVGTVVATTAWPTRWWTKAVRGVAASTRRIFVTAPAASRPKRRHHLALHSLLEDSRMEREMHRL